MAIKTILILQEFVNWIVLKTTHKIKHHKTKNWRIWKFYFLQSYNQFNHSIQVQARRNIHSPLLWMSVMLVMLLMMMSPCAGASAGPYQRDAAADEQVSHSLWWLMSYHYHYWHHYYYWHQGAAAEVRAVSHLLTPHRGSSNSSEALWWDSQEVKCH